MLLCLFGLNLKHGCWMMAVRKLRMIPRRKLKSTYSLRSAMYMQAGAQYVRHVSTLVKTGINSLKIASFPVQPEGLESFHHFLWVYMVHLYVWKNLFLDIVHEMSLLDITTETFQCYCFGYWGSNHMYLKFILVC